MQREGEGVVVRQAHLIAVVVAFLIGGAVLLSGWRFGSAGGNLQERRSPVRGDEHHQEPGVRFRGGALYHQRPTWLPKGGLLLGTDKDDRLYGKDGDDVIRGLGG